MAAQWMRPLFEEVFEMKIGPIITQLDNTAALLTATGPKITSRNRHFVMRQATVREAVEAGLIKP